MNLALNENECISFQRSRTTSVNDNDHYLKQEAGYASDNITLYCHIPDFTHCYFWKHNKTFSLTDSCHKQWATELSELWSVVCGSGVSFRYKADQLSPASSTSSDSHIPLTAWLAGKSIFIFVFILVIQRINLTPFCWASVDVF